MSIEEQKSPVVKGLTTLFGRARQYADEFHSGRGKGSGTALSQDGTFAPGWKREMVRGLFGTGLRVASTLLSLAFGILGARLLGAVEFGKYVAIQASAGLLGVAMSFGMPAVLGREIAAARGSGGTHALGAILHFAVAVIALAGIATVAFLVVSRETATFTLALATVSYVVGFAAAVHVGYERVILVSWITGICGPVLAIVGLYGAAYFRVLDARAALCAQIGSQLVVLILFVVCTKQSWAARVWSELMQPLRWTDQHTNVATMGLMVGGGQLLIQALTQVDILILSYFASSREVAEYFAATRAALFVVYFFGVSISLAEPKFTRLYSAGRSEELQIALTQTSRICFAMTAATAGVTAAVGPIYLSLYGEGFVEAYPSLLIAICGFVIFSAYGPAQTMLRAGRKDSTIVAITAMALLVGALLCVLLIPVNGVAGAALASACQFSLYGLLLSRQVRKQLALATPALSQS